MFFLKGWETFQVGISGQMYCKSYRGLIEL